jgi:hypothetical protein
VGGCGKSKTRPARSSSPCTRGKCRECLEDLPERRSGCCLKESLEKKRRRENMVVGVAKGGSEVDLVECLSVPVSFEELRSPVRLGLGVSSASERSSRPISKNSSVQSSDGLSPPGPRLVLANRDGLGKTRAKIREEFANEGAEPRKEPRRLRASLDCRRICEGDVGMRDKSFKYGPAQRKVKCGTCY